MRSNGNRIKSVIFTALFAAALAMPTFAQSALVKEMANLDLVYIPALALSNMGKPEATSAAVAKLQSQWTVFLATAEKAFPGDKDWAKGLENVEQIIAKAGLEAQSGNLPGVHEALEGVRITFLELREKRNIQYYLDSYTRYHDAMEKTTAILDGKKSTDLTAADIIFVNSMIPVLKTSWEAALAAVLDADLFQLDAAKVAQIRSAMNSVYAGIVTLETAVRDGLKEKVYEALNTLKPSFTKAFLLFGKF